VSSRSRILAAAVLAVALAAGCAGTAPTSPLPAPTSPATGAPATIEPTPEPLKLVVGLGFIPSVQFAPFYLAQQAGYYAEVGLEVEFQNRIDPDLIALVGQGSIDVGLADGTSMIPAVSQGIPVRYLATVYGRFPSILFAKASVGLSPDDLQIIEYPDFGQGAAVAQGAVDVATGFANNEPVQLELTGETAVVLRVDDVVALPGPGMIAGTAILESNPDAVQSFVTATLRAMEEIAANPSLGLEAALVAVPDLATDRAVQDAILRATIDTWRGRIQAERGLGAVDRDGWAASITFLTGLGLVPNPVTVDDILRDDLLPAGD
jgi:NitT/TauT family transport system substrate-binding protein